MISKGREKFFLEKQVELENDLETLKNLYKTSLDELMLTKKALEDSNKLVSLNPNTTMLDHILSVGKNLGDNRGLGFVDSSSTSTPSTKTVFVLASKPYMINLNIRNWKPFIDVNSRPTVKSMY